MRKWRVNLIRFSPELADGSRETRERQEICSCKNRGDAELILRHLKEDYSCLTSDRGPNLPLYILAIE